MQRPVTPFTAIVVDDLRQSDLLYEGAHENYSIQICQTRDSLWLIAGWPGTGKIAFRLAFAMNSHFEKVALTDLADGLLVTASTSLGKYRTTVTYQKSDKPLIRYTTSFRAAFPFLIPYWPRDIVPLVEEGRTENTSGVIHAHQVGGRSGQLFFSMTKPKTGSVFYFQNLSALSPYCEACQTTVADTVGGQWPEIGFQFPINTEKPVPPDTEFIISDAFVLLSGDIPEKDSAIARQFMDYLAAVYMHLPKPKTQYRDWPGIAKKTLKGLYTNKGCWTMTNGVPYLNAYVGDYKTPAEIMVQLAVLLPLQEYLEWTGGSHGLFDDLNEGLVQFYDDRVKSIVRWHPSLEDDLDKSEEQKREMVMDSWYLHHPLLNLCRLALKGDAIAEKLFLDSVGYAIKVAHHFDYQWPVFYKMTTLEVLKAETTPGNGGEKDVPGSYAHVMLMAYKLTGEKRFLNEAVKAVRHLDGLGLDIFYQANNTAFAAGALMELYNETGDGRYIELSHCCLAGLLKNVQLWECNYGNGKEFPNFFAVFPLNDAPYTAAYEELEVYAALHHYLLVAKAENLLPSLHVLLPEFIKYAVNRLPFYYPPLMPEDIIAKDIKTGEVVKDLWVPLEDMHDGWEANGEVGQEVYGAGLPFGIVPRQYYHIKDTQMVLFTDYPASHFKASGNTVTFTLIGFRGLEARLRLLGTRPGQPVKVEQKTSGRYEPVPPLKKGGVEFGVRADSRIRITWGVKV